MAKPYVFFFSRILNFKFLAIFLNTEVILVVTFYMSVHMHVCQNLKKEELKEQTSSILLKTTKKVLFVVFEN